MIDVTKIPHLKMHRSKTVLPTNQRTPSMYGVVFLNTTNVDSSIKLMTSKQIDARHRYNTYYIDGIYKETILKRMIRENITKERQEIYQNVKSSTSSISTLTTVDAAKKRNLFFDLSHYNQLFLSQTQRNSVIVKKAEDYMELVIGRIINGGQFKDYLTKVMLIDVDDWKIGKNFTKDKMTRENPVFYLYTMMYKSFDKFKELGNVDIVIVSGTQTIRVNPSLSDKMSYMTLSRLLVNMSVELDSMELGMDEDNKDVEAVMTTLVSAYGLTGTSKVDELIEDKVQKLEKEGKKIEATAPNLILDELGEDKELVQNVMVAMQQEKTGQATQLSKRDLELREKQKELTLRGKTLEDILSVDQKTIKLETTDVSDKVITMNENVTNVRFPSFEKTYNEHLLVKDTVSILKSLNDASIPVHVRSIDVEDTSDKLNHKETYTVSLEDTNRVRHTLKFDMPKFIDDKFMYLNGNKKMFVKQFFLKPIVKPGPSTVQICTNYNKVFIRREGQKVSSKIERFRKALSVKGIKGVQVKYGSSTATNVKYRTTIEYDEISKSVTYIKAGKAEFYFNQEEVANMLEKLNIQKNVEGFLCVGFFDKKTPILVDIETQMLINSEDDIIDVVLGESPELLEVFGTQKAGKKFMYTKATIVEKSVGTALLVSYLIGLSGLLRRANIVHHFTDTRPRIDDSKEGVIPFSDGYLVYDKYPFENSLLMNAFYDVPTKGYEYAEFDQKEVYLTFFDILFKRRNLGPAYDNYNDLMVDPITKEVLEDLNLPTNFVDLVIYANRLLVDNAYVPENDMSLYRIRSNEMANSYFYKAFASAYENYRMTANNNNPVKMSIPRDKVLKNLLMSQVVEDYSVLNPIVELEKSRAVTPKGPNGMNLSSAFTQDKRAYNPTMLGVVAMSTSPDANVGIVRQLSLEPNIIGPRGYIDVKHNDLDSLKDANIFSPAEMMSPLGASRDDSNRTAMSTKQSKHIIPIEKSSPVLISNGAEQIIHYHLSDDFSVVAKQDGVVKEINDDTGNVIVQYKDNTHQAFNIKPRIVKNGAGGFYLSNQLVTKYKVGEKFKQNDVIAYDKKFFTPSDTSGVRFNIGSLQKVAVMGGYATYEDSTFITEKMSQDMAADIVMQKSVVIGKNSNIDHIVKVGDSIKVGDELLRFEQSFDDESLNSFLSNVGEELQEEILSLGKTPIKSKYSGTIEDIKIYSTVDLDDMSPSLRKVVSAHYNKIDKSRKQLDKYDNSQGAYKLGVMVNEPTEKIETANGKIKGSEVGEGVLIEIYIKYRDTLGVGDKIAFFTALKSIIGEVIPEGLEPYALSRPEEEISSVIAPGAILARMTPSILLTMFTNKNLHELKLQLKDIYSGTKK